MNQNKREYKDDIERAERNILIVSWVGIAAALGVIASAIVGMQ
jgi:hypothetical protein